MSIKEKIKSRLDALESALKEGEHLRSDESKSETEALIDSVSKFYSVLNDEERDLLGAARYALEANMPWK